MIHPLEYTIKVIAFGLLLQGCYSFHVPMKETPKNAAQYLKEEYFAGNDFPKDGGIAFSFYKDSKKSFTGELDYLLLKEPSTSVPQLRGEWLDPLGRTLLHFKQQGEMLSFAGQVADKLRPLKTKQNGFLYFEDYFLGLKAEELSGFVQFKWPRSWYRQLCFYDESPTEMRFFIKEPDREVLVTLPKIPSSHQCTEINWYQFWGLKKSSLKICLDKTKGQLKLPNADEFQWRKTDE